MNPRDNMPPSENPDDRRLHAALRALPELEAPSALVPGVLAAIRARQQAASAPVAWYRRPATTWSPVARVALGVTALALLGAIVFGAQLLWPSLETVSETSGLTTTASKFEGLWSAGGALVEACGLVLRNLLSPVVIAVIAVAAFSYVTLLGIGSALWRSALQPRSQ